MTNFLAPDAAPAPGTEDELSEQQLKAGYWWLSHKVFLRKFSTVVLGVLAFSLFLYGAWGFIDWFFVSGVRERAGIALLTRNLTDYSAFRRAAAPQPLDISSPIALTSSEGRYDLIARLSNSNPNWWLEFDYQFKGEGLPDTTAAGFLLPADSRYIYDLGVASTARPSATLEMTNVRWHRVTAHVSPPDYTAWSNARTDLTIAEVKFVPPDPTSSTPAVSRAQFRVTNNTAFGFVSALFIVTISNGGLVVGVNRVVATHLLPGETRDMEATWYRDLRASRVEVQPELNIFDNRIYLKPGE